MPQRPTVEEPSPARTYRPQRQIVVYLCFTYGLALAIALALPHAGIAPLITIAVPVTAVARSPLLSLFHVVNDVRFGRESDSTRVGGAGC